MPPKPVPAQAEAMKEMCKNIMMEAAEKCEEIDVKCDEEYRILRKKEIRTQMEKIANQEKIRRETALRNNRVFYTKLVNQARLYRLKAKNDVIVQVIKEVKDKLMVNRGRAYQDLIEKAMLQAMYALMEDELKAKCKKKDRDIVQSCFVPASNTYHATTKKPMKICLDNEPLPDKTLGGLIVLTKDGAIAVDCLLDSRVEDVCRLAMPQIIQMLFGGLQLMVQPIAFDQVKTDDLSELNLAFKSSKDVFKVKSSLDLVQHDSVTKTPSPHGSLDEKK